LFRPEFVDQARKLCQLGPTDVEVARFFQVDPSTIYLWRIQHPEFSESMKIGKALPDDRVERSLYQRACGYEVEVKKTVIKKEGRDVVTTTTECREHIPGDVTAQTRWLTNRRPRQWRGDMPDGTQPQERSTAEIKELVIAKLLEWGLKVVPIDAAPSPIMLEGDTPKPNGGGNGEDR
jgi:hypothetical protein